MIAHVSKRLLLSPNATIVLYSTLLALPGIKDFFGWFGWKETFSNLFIPVFVVTIVCNTCAVCIWRGDGIDKFSARRISIFAAGLLAVLALLSFWASHSYQLEQLLSKCGKLSAVVVAKRDVSTIISSGGQKFRFVMSGDIQKSIARGMSPGDSVCVFFESGEQYPVEIVADDKVVYSREQYIKSNRGQRFYGGIILTSASLVLILLKRRSSLLKQPDLPRRSVSPVRS